MNDLRKAAEALLAIIDAYEEENGPWGTVVTDNAFAALRAALDAPQATGVTVEEVARVVADTLSDIAGGCLDFAEPASPDDCLDGTCPCAKATRNVATALLPLFERARLAGFAEGIEAAAKKAAEAARYWATAAAADNADFTPLERRMARAASLADDWLAASIRSLAPVSRDDGWQPIETAPRDGQKLLVARKGYGHGGWVRMIASFIPKHTEESSEDYAEYDEASDTYFTPEGWYEQCYEHDEWSSIRMSTDPLKWRPLPAPPAQGGE